MSEFTLRQLCEACGVSRRTVQGYEKHGLVAAGGRTSRGYLLYDDAACVKVRKIRDLQEFGFELKEIVRLQQLDESEQRKELKLKLLSLLMKKSILEQSIAKINKMITEGL